MAGLGQDFSKHPEARLQRCRDRDEGTEQTRLAETVKVSESKLNSTTLPNLVDLIEQQDKKKRRLLLQRWEGSCVPKQSF